MKNDFAYCNWFITYDKTTDDVRPGGRSIRAKILPATFMGKPALLFKYGRGLREKSIIRHYPKEQGFEVYPIRGKTSTFDFYLL